MNANESLIAYQIKTPLQAEKSKSVLSNLITMVIFTLREQCLQVIRRLLVTANGLILVDMTLSALRLYRFYR